MVYGKKHKIVLQSVMHEGVLIEDRVKSLIKYLFDHNDTAEILSEINEKLKPLCMTIKCINCEVDGQLYWIFTSTVQDKSTSFHPEFSQVELALLRHVFSKIITSDDGYVSSTWCLNLCSSLGLKLTKAVAEEFFHEMVKRHWLSCKNGKYYIGVRSIGELMQYFQDTYEDNLRTCNLCQQALFYGESCNKCNITSHSHCLKDYALNHGDLGCPNCLMSEHNLDATSSAMDINIEMTQPSQIKRPKKRYRNKDI